MPRKLKNILLVWLMLVSVVGIALTINHAKNNLSVNNMREIPTDMKIDSGTQNNNGQPPEKPNNPNGESSMTPPRNDISHENIQTEKMPDGMLDGERPNDNLPRNNKLTTNYIIVIGLFSGLFSISFIYLIMSLKNQKFYKNKDKFIIYVLGNLILITGLTVGLITLSNKLLRNNNPNNQEEIEKDQVVLDKSNVISEGYINLNNQNTDVTITSGGTYTFNGLFTHSIIIDTKNEDVEIVLNGVEITNEHTATIIGLSANKITIHLEDGTVNKLTDGGNSEYDGCIFSNAELVFEGNGRLEVNGEQNEGEGIATETKNITFNSGTYIITSNDDGINAGGDGATITFNGGSFYINASGDGIDSNKNAVINDGTIFVIGSDIGGDAGIDTDNGYTINGGMVIALGSDMIETPEESSKQKVIAFTLDNAINKETIVTLMKNDEVISSFEAPKSFRTIIISSNKIEDGEYSLYTGGSNSGDLVNGIYENGKYRKGDIISVNKSTTFQVSKIINLFGNSNRQEKNQ